MKKRATMIAVIIVILCAIWVGFSVPIDSYTTAGGCLTGDEPIKLYLVRGDSLDTIRNNPEEVKSRQYFSLHTGPLDECGPSRIYELYIF